MGFPLVIHVAVTGFVDTSAKYASPPSPLIIHFSTQTWCIFTLSSFLIDPILPSSRPVCNHELIADWSTTLALYSCLQFCPSFWLCNTDPSSVSVHLFWSIFFWYVLGSVSFFASAPPSISTPKRFQLSSRASFHVLPSSSFYLLHHPNKLFSSALIKETLPSPCTLYLSRTVCSILKLSSFPSSSMSCRVQLPTRLTHSVSSYFFLLAYQSTTQLFVALSSFAQLDWALPAKWHPTVMLSTVVSVTIQIQFWIGICGC